MKKMRFFAIFLSFLLAASALTVPALGASDDPAVTEGCHSIDAAMTLSEEGKLTETAQAIVLYERNSDTMLYTWNPDAKIYPTSMVKLMTVLVALENGNPDDVVTVTRKVLDQVAIGSVSANLKSGEEITLRDLMYCTMVASANDAATVIANYIGGSASAFVDMMNEKAAALGCKGTHYSNVHGLHDEDTYTTARDICRITETALDNEMFRTMFCTSTYTVPATNKSAERVIETTNYMMSDKVYQKYYDKRVIGGKTGATDKGGRCLTLLAEDNGMEILCVLMGATPTVAENGSLSAFGSFEESQVIVDYAFKSFEYRQVFFEGQSLSQYAVDGGANDVVTQAAESASTVLPVDTDESLLKWVYEKDAGQLTAPLEIGDKIGSVQAWYGNKCLAQTDMVAMNRVEKYQAPIVPEKPKSNTDGGSWLMLFLALLGIAFAVFAVSIGIRAIRIMKYQRRRNRRRGRR